MTRDEFCQRYWRYYIALENDFMMLEKYISFDCLSLNKGMLENGKVYSMELMKQFQSICAEMDTIFKVMCKELGDSESNSIVQYADTILTSDFESVCRQRVFLLDECELCPFHDWKVLPSYNSPNWWKMYGKCKHSREQYFENANLQNTVNALAALFILEVHLVRYVGQKTGDMDVPDDASRLFTLIDFKTEREVLWRNQYTMSAKEIEDALK